jgi:glycosyltransferase involved in cell wall biosynthesis
MKHLISHETKPRLRLLFNGLHSRTGGGLTYFKNILPLITADRDMDVHLCIHEDQRELLPDNLENITIHYLEFTQGFWRLQFHEQISVPKLARKINADVTFSPANYGPIMAPRTVVLLRNALSVAFVEHRPLKLAYWALVYAGTTLSVLCSRRAITVSKYACSAAESGLIGLFRTPFTVIYHGVSDKFSPYGKNTKRERFLLAVSDLYVQKNLKNLLWALKTLKYDHPDVTLKIAGRPVDAEYFAEIKQIVADQKLEGKVEFLGDVPPENLVELYRRCGVFVFPSTVETFGNPLVEAMACGAPIASSHSAAMPEVIGDAAVFFDPLDIDHMAKVIGLLLDDAKLCQDLSQKALKRAKNFSWEKTAARTLDVIREAADKP